MTHATMAPPRPPLAPAALPASPRRRWPRRRRPWQPSQAQIGAARALALEIVCRLTHDISDAGHVADRGLHVRDWLTGAGTEAEMTARYAGARQVLANVTRHGSQYSPDPPSFVTAAGRYARFLLGS